jgi:protein-tyrosine phosphatase
MSIKGLKNFRDLGGIKAGDKHLRKGFLFRSEVPVKVSAEEMLRFRTPFEIDMLIDLRTQYEAEEKPYTLPEGVEYLHMPMFEESLMGITRDSGSSVGKYLIRKYNRQEIRHHLPDIEKLYIDVMKEKSVLEMTGKVMRQVISNTLEWKSTLFHCSWGKDRAGVLAAFLLSLLGVGMAEIVKDYTYTNRAVRSKAIQYAVLVFLFKQDRVAARKVWRGSLAKPNYIRGVFEAIESDYGSTENFFREALGISDELRDAFRDRMLI